jgi:hypothetical protein
MTNIKELLPSRVINNKLYNPRTSTLVEVRRPRVGMEFKALFCKTTGELFEVRWEYRNGGNSVCLVQFEPVTERSDLSSYDADSIPSRAIKHHSIAE